jgi:hypothetical protein
MEIFQSRLKVAAAGEQHKFTSLEAIVTQMIFGIWKSVQADVKADVVMNNIASSGPQPQQPEGTLSLCI